MKKITESLSKEIVAAQEGEIVGIVTNAYVDKKLSRVRGYKVSSDDRDAGRLLPLRRLVSESDALIVRGVAVLQEPSLPDCPLGAKVFDTTGNFVGILRDLLFDEKTGAILTLVADEGEIDPARVVGFGKSAVLLRAPCHEGFVFRVRSAGYRRKKITPPLPLQASETEAPLASTESIPSELPAPETTIPEHAKELFAGEYAFLLGRKVLKPILFGQEIIAQSESLVTPETIAKAREKGKLVELTVNSRKV